MENKLRKINQYFKIISEKRFIKKDEINSIVSCPSDYKVGNTLPTKESMLPFNNGNTWGSGKDSHAWFRFEATPSAPYSRLRIETEYNGWDADNPQFILYIDGKMVQGLDTNHREYPLEYNKSVDVALYAYTGPKIEKAKLFASIVQISPDAENLYFDIKYPLDMLKYLDKHSAEYASIVDYLWRAVSMLSLYDIDSEDFYSSLKRSHEFMNAEFYGKYCAEQKTTTVGIGHTHIDCAWLWTLKQTREKVQRSFATVLSLMERYPEYKFMSSQALLYKNLKEEAPDLYAKVGERIKEGRWECEGSMWVEADCNLASGESLVRQILYGKNFFKDEFGVENRVLWLPDVFGYTAALPQILCKSGVDWFVTSKISWNDTNSMPYDTFMWRGIDGTQIKTHFLTASDHVGGDLPRHCTYVGNTNAPMVSGTIRRYYQKNLHNEALLTFGYGDGGGGPTAEHLEIARRAEKGIPGSPNLKIGFAGNYLRRLENAMRDRTDVPQWQGELYLEFHRGTYTTMARNKRNNRQCEFIYEDAELLSTTAAALLKKVFPQEDLHKGWETILTNQFHDIIPGSSIEEVYAQSDIDYAEAKKIGNGIISSAQCDIAERIDKDHGYVVFNPHSFVTQGMLKVDGKTVFSKEKIPAKGYLATNAFIDTNAVRIDGRTVETNRLRVTFDEHWQLISVFDKIACREVLKAGECGNQLRVHADYPDIYDAWEWQSYSREEYRAITDVSNVSIVDDGIRKGLHITRPYMNSTIEQTIWFYDDLCRVDFETVADWHDRHQMLKAVFPVDVNTSKATYEIQFGTVERPTHENTSWDRAKFEVCAHKYADISEGGYGVALMNDCKYGHDIHDGVIQLSLLRSPTYPNPEADQGKIPVTYSLVPHIGTLNETDVASQAYYLNYPMTAVKASGKQDILPLSFSALSLSSENVICETVKKAERDNDTVIRLYESQNKRTSAVITLGIPANEVYLCDMMENEIKPIEISNGKITVDFNGFEIITLKVKA